MEAYEKHGKQARDAAARRAADAFDREHLFALAEVVGEHGDAAVDGRVAEGVDAVVDEIGDGEPCEFARLRDARGDGEEQYDGEGYRHHGHAQPRHELVAALELDLVEESAEDGVVEGVPDLHRKHDEGDLSGVHTLHDGKGGEEGRNEGVDEVLTREVGVVADLFPAGDHVALLSQPQHGLDKVQDGVLSLGARRGRSEGYAVGGDDVAFGSGGLFLRFRVGHGDGRSVLRRLGDVCRRGLHRGHLFRGAFRDVAYDVFFIAHGISSLTG